mgnify:CR=1 FL=1
MKQSAIILVITLVSTLSCATDYRNMHSFETAWQTVNQAHYDPAFGNIDWKEVHKKYETQIAVTKNKEESVRLINQMLFELGLSHHLAVYPYDMKIFMPVLFAEGGIGTDVRLIDGEAVITMVRSGSPADRKGLRPGFVVECINGKHVGEMIKDGDKLLIPPFNARNRLNNLSCYISGHIYGPPKTKVKITFRNADGKRNEIVVRRISRGRGRVAMEAMPPYYFEFEAKRLPDNIGYFRFNHWADPADKKFISALASMRDVKGIIIDLRGNPGGILSVVHTITKHLLAEKTQVSTWKYKDKQVDYSFDPDRNAYLGQVVILIDFRSTSSSEYFAGSMQSIKRAVIIGERSPGYLLIANWKKLLNGTSLMYAFALPILPDGKVIEGKGVVPDIEICLERDELLQGNDTQLEAAIDFILKRKKLFNMSLR